MAKAIEQFGSGFKRVNSLCEDVNIKYEYTMLDNGFEFLFNRKIVDSQEVNDNDVFEFVLSKQAKIAYDYLKLNPGYTREDLSQLMSKSERTVQRYFNELRKKGYIKRVGSDKTGHWKILK